MLLDMKNSKNSKLDITLKDYIDLLNKYNANSEFLNAKIRVLNSSYNILSNLVVAFSIVICFLVAWIVVLYFW